MAPTEKKRGRPDIPSGYGCRVRVQDRFLENSPVRPLLSVLVQILCTVTATHSEAEFESF